MRALDPQGLHNLHLQAVMKMATLFQSVMVQEANDGHTPQATTPSTSVPSNLPRATSSLPASPLQQLQNGQSCSTKRQASPGTHSEAIPFQPALQLGQHPTHDDAEALLEPTDLLLLDEMFSKGQSSLLSQQQQQQSDKQMSNQQQAQQLPEEGPGTCSGKELQQEVALWCWNSSYSHLSGSGPPAELISATAAAGQHKSASWDVLVVSQGKQLVSIRTSPVVCGYHDVFPGLNLGRHVLGIGLQL